MFGIKDENKGIFACFQVFKRSHNPFTQSSRTKMIIFEPWEDKFRTKTLRELEYHFGTEGVQNRGSFF